MIQVYTTILQEIPMKTIIAILLFTAVSQADLAFYCVHDNITTSGYTIYTETLKIDYKNDTFRMTLIDGQDILPTAFEVTNYGYIMPMTQNHVLMFNRANRSATLKKPIYCSSNSCQYEDVVFRCSTWRE